jgi:hypothetical protein
MTTAQILKTLQHPVAPAVTFRVALKWWWRHLTATFNAVTPRFLK